MVPDPLASEQPSMTSAVERVLSASQQLVVDRLDLLLLEAKQGMNRGIEAAVVAGFAVGVIFFGWLCINAALAVWFRETASLSGILAVLAIVNLGVGASAIVMARQLAMPGVNAEGGRSPIEKAGT
jgi:uncharacterized membrane protein YqjE